MMGLRMDKGVTREQSAAIQYDVGTGLPRRFAPRNDGWE